MLNSAYPFALDILTLKKNKGQLEQCYYFRRNLVLNPSLLYWILAFTGSKWSVLSSAVALACLDLRGQVRLPVVWYYDVADLLVAVYEAVCCALPCHCLLVSLNHDRWWFSVLIIHGLGQFPEFIAISVQVQLVCFFSPACSCSLYVGLSEFGSAGFMGYVVLWSSVVFNLLSGSGHFILKPL